MSAVEAGPSARRTCCRSSAARASSRAQRGPSPSRPSGEPGFVERLPAALPLDRRPSGPRAALPRDAQRRCQVAGDGRMSSDVREHSDRAQSGRRHRRRRRPRRARRNGRAGRRRKRVILLEQEPEQSLGGQAFWSFGGLFLVDSPEQRRLRIKDSHELAWQDWLGTAGFDRPEDEWPRRWAEAYVDLAAGEKREWLHAQGNALPAQRRLGGARRQGAIGHGNSVPRFHVTWGTGPGLIEPFVAARARGEEQRARRAALPPPRRRGSPSRTAPSTVSPARCSHPTRCARGQSSSRRRRRRVRAGGGR